MREPSAAKCITAGHHPSICELGELDARDPVRRIGPTPTGSVAKHPTVGLGASVQLVHDPALEGVLLDNAKRDAIADNEVADKPDLGSEVEPLLAPDVEHAPDTSQQAVADDHHDRVIRADRLRQSEVDGSIRAPATTEALMLPCADAVTSGIR
jgi:hypothetical protein